MPHTPADPAKDTVTVPVRHSAFEDTMHNFYGKGPVANATFLRPIERNKNTHMLLEDYVMEPSKK